MQRHESSMCVCTRMREYRWGKVERAGYAAVAAGLNGRRISRVSHSSRSRGGAHTHMYTCTHSCASSDAPCTCTHTAPPISVASLCFFFPNTFTSALHAQHVAHEGEFTYATSSHAPPTSLIFFSASLEKNLALTTIG